MLPKVAVVCTHEAISDLAVSSIASLQMIICHRHIPTKVLVANRPMLLAALIGAVAEVMAVAAFAGIRNDRSFEAKGA